MEQNPPSQPRHGGLAAKAMTSQWNHTCLSPSLETELWYDMDRGLLQRIYTCISATLQ